MSRKRITILNKPETAQVGFISNVAEKPKKIPFRLIKRFLQIGNFKKFKGVPFVRIQKFSEKMSHSAEKNRKGGPLVSPLLLEA